VCVSLSAISYNNNPLPLQSIGRIRTKKERKKENAMRREVTTFALIARNMVMRTLA